MPQYRVIGARIADGTEVDRNLTADNEAHARRYLEEQGVAISELREISSPAASAHDPGVAPASHPPTDPTQARMLADVAASLATLTKAAEDLRKHTRAIRRQTTIVHLATAIVVGLVFLSVLTFVAALALEAAGLSGIAGATR